MKTKVCVLIFVTLCYLHASSQDFDPVALASQKAILNRAKEKVKVERIYLFSVTKNEKVSKKGALLYETYFNEQGKITKNTNFFPKSTIISENEYDKRGNQTKLVSKAKSGAIRQTLVFEYDDTDALVQVRNYDPAGKMTSINDINQKKEGDYTTSYDSKGGVISKSLKKYDPANKTYTSQLINPTGEIRHMDNYLLSGDSLILEWLNIDNIQSKRSVTKYSYDKNGNRIEELKFDAAGKLKEKKVTTYTDKNLISEQTLYQPGDKLFQVFKHEYTF